MLKWFVRLLMFLVIATFGFLIVCHFAGIGETIISAQDKYILVKIPLAIFSVIGPLSIIILWGLMIYDWGTREFKHLSHKKKWFLVLIIGGFIGSWVYYLCVFESEYSLKKDESQQQN